jgi:hypothetical protein
MTNSSQHWDVYCSDFYAICNQCGSWWGPGCTQLTCVLYTTMVDHQNIVHPTRALAVFPWGFLRYPLGIGVKHYVVSTQGEGRQRIHQELFHSDPSTSAYLSELKEDSPGMRFFVCPGSCCEHSLLHYQDNGSATSSRHLSASNKSIRMFLQVVFPHGIFLGNVHSC